MKKIIFFLLATISLISCEDIESNDIALQAKIGDRLFVSNEARASLNEDGSLTIQGFTQEESLTLQLSRLVEGNFNIAEGSPNSAIFEDMGGNVYTTRPNGAGTVSISELNETNKTLTGTFHFNAFLTGIDTIYVSKGVFHNVSYTGGDILDPTNAGTFTAKINGNPFLPILVTSRDTGNAVIISGTGTNSSIVISVPSNVETGEYTIPRGGFSAKYQDATGPETTDEGVIKIIDHNTSEKTIKGTFSFVTNRSEITEGEFNISY